MFHKDTIAKNNFFLPTIIENSVGMHLCRSPHPISCLK